MPTAAKKIPLGIQAGQGVGDKKIVAPFFPDNSLRRHLCREQIFHASQHHFKPGGRALNIAVQNGVAILKMCKQIINKNCSELQPPSHYKAFSTAR
jgi:hypothetical protein